MAKIDKNANVLGLSGSVGNLVFRQMKDGSVRVCSKPDFSKRVFSQEQVEHQSRFKQAVAYARQAARTQPIYAKLAKGTTKNAYNIALSDWFNPPVIHRIEHTKEAIRVWASDKVLVTGVHVRIMDMEGNVLEEGQAEQVDPARDPERWEYVPNMDGSIEAIARDLAGNETRAIL